MEIDAAHRLRQLSGIYRFCEVWHQHPETHCASLGLDVALGVHRHPKGWFKPRWHRREVAAVPDWLIKHRHFGAFASPQQFATPFKTDGEPHWVGLYFDLDDGPGFGEKAKTDLIKLIDFLCSMGLRADDIILHYTGLKGFRLIVPPTVLGVIPAPDLTTYCKFLARQLREELGLQTIDLAVYNRGLLRVPNTIHEKTLADVALRYCIPITVGELELTIPSIRDLARAPRGASAIWDYFAFGRNLRAAAWFADSYAEFRAMPAVEKGPPIPREAMASLTEVPHCIKDLEQRSIRRDGDRQKAVLTLTSCLRGLGAPEAEQRDRAIALVQSIPSHLSDSPISDREANVDGVISFLRNHSDDPNYSFRCGQALALGLPCAGPSCRLFDYRLNDNSFRKFVWADDNVEAPGYTVMTRDAARQWLRSLIGGLGKDGKVHVLTGGPPGVGKTHVLAEVMLAESRTIWLAQQHQQLDTPQQIAEKSGARVCRFEKLDEKTCIQFERVQTCLGAGIDYRAVICRDCPLFNQGCKYLAGFHGSEGAASILATQHHHRFAEKFYEGHANSSRPWLIFDENPLESLRPSRELQTSQVRAYIDLLDKTLDSASAQ